jgi:hemerythrin
MEWTDAIAVGIRSIDEQHRRFLALVNRLYDAAQEADRACPPGELVAGLRAYAAEHFHIEEGYMQAFAYPDLAQHQSEHQGFIDVVRGFASACAEGNAGADEILAYLKDWLPRHLREADVRLGRFLEDCLR